MRARAAGSGGSALSPADLLPGLVGWARAQPCGTWQLLSGRCVRAGALPTAGMRVKNCLVQPSDFRDSSAEAVGTGFILTIELFIR